MCIACDELINAIDNYIAKANDNLADLLRVAGFANPKETVKRIEQLEEKLVEIFEDETASVEQMLKDAIEEGIELEDVVVTVWEELKKVSDTKTKLFPAFFDAFSDYIPQLANVYMSQMDSELVVNQISAKTTSWIAQWSYELSDLMKLSSHDEIESVLTTALKNGKSVADLSQHILENGIRDEYYKAKRVAVTETLRAHSVAREESIQQCPAAEFKEWVHTGSYRNEPRANHVAISGQLVPCNEPFTLVGRDGTTYYPDCPHDTCLPAEETINCHCIHRGIASEKILGLSLEERKRLQQQAIDEMDDDWEKELDAENKARAGINEDTINCDWLKNKTVEERKKYFRSDSRWALFESGVVQNDADLERLYKTVDTPRGPRKVFKSLTELKEDGIITVSDKALKHSTFGDFTNLKNPKKPPGGKNGGNMKGGGHSQSNIDLLKSKGVSHKITNTYSNGVRVGNVNGHVAKPKREDSGQSWFPESWDNDEVLKAGTYVANKSSDSGNRKFYEYNGVRVGIFVGNDGCPSTIFPDADSQP